MLMRCLVQYFLVPRLCSLQFPEALNPNALLFFMLYVSFPSCPWFFFFLPLLLPVCLTLSLSCGRLAVASKAKCFISIHSEVIHTQIGRIITPWLRCKLLAAISHTSICLKAGLPSAPREPSQQNHNITSYQNCS